jgi:hypothetical protein
MLMSRLPVEISRIAQADFVRGIPLAFAWLQPILLQRCQPSTTPKQARRSILHFANSLLTPDRLGKPATFHANVFCACDLAITRHRHRQLPPTHTITRGQPQCHAPSRISRISQRARSPADSAPNTRSVGISQPPLCFSESGDTPCLLVTRATAALNSSPSSCGLSCSTAATCRSAFCISME